MIRFTLLAIYRVVNYCKSLAISSTKNLGKFSMVPFVNESKPTTPKQRSDGSRLNFTEVECGVCAASKASRSALNSCLILLLEKPLSLWSDDIAPRNG